jgi:putative hemolysin
MKQNVIAIILLLVIVSLAGCSKKSNPAPDANTTFPQFISLTADKDSIQVGGADPAILTCMASGGNISYTWEVDLGDIFPLNEEGSQVRFTGSECCLGEKYIKCTIANDKGSIMDTVMVFIFIP